MAKKDQQDWLYKISTTLTVVMVLLIFSYFTQSFIEIRSVKPVKVAIERLQEKSGRAKLPDSKQKRVPHREVDVLPN